jgi:ATP-dependent Clp protease, protease subunit
MRNRSPFHRGPANVRVLRAEDSSSSAEVLLYDEIGFFGIEARTLVPELKALDVDELHVRINSPGGSVFDGVAIANALREHKARVIVHVDGLAASIASVIAMAGDDVRMAENAFLMIHEPWNVSIGNADALRKDAEILDKIGETLIATYVARTDADESEVRAWMKDETWFTAAEAKAAGFIDAVVSGAGVRAAFDLSAFAKVPAALAEEPAVPAKRDLERALRDAGLSRSAAKAILAGGYAALETPREAAPDEPVLPDPQSPSPDEAHVASLATLAARITTLTQ